MTTPVIVCLTTIPARNGTLGTTINSLRRQSRPPDEIRLYLPEGCTAWRGVPRVSLVRNIPVNDRGPVTKLSAVEDPSLPDDAIIVTADDDITYHRDWLGKLVRAADRHPCDAVGYHGWDVGNFLADPVNGQFISAKYPMTCDVLEGFAGVAYRKRFFRQHPQRCGRGAPSGHAQCLRSILDPPDEFRWVDDVWVSVSLACRGVTRRLISARKMSQANKLLPGIHDRADFVELNRRAAVMGFKP